MASILVVDDEPDLRELLRVNLVLDGHEVTTAADGEAALTALNGDGDRPDLVLLDVMMPHRDGWSVLEAIKAAEQWSNIPVVMLTARGGDLDRLRGGIEGALRYVSKPFALADVRAAIDQVLSGVPEKDQRRLVQHSALVELAQREAGSATVVVPGPPAARPRVTRLDGTAMRPKPVPSRRVVSRSDFSPGQCAVLDAAVETSTLQAAAVSLGVSRSYLYASMRRLADKIGVDNGPELARLLRSGEITVR